MYTRLTKEVVIDGRKCIVCSQYGTEGCRIHSGTNDCLQCEVFAAILNQLAYFEDIVCEMNGEAKE